MNNYISGAQIVVEALLEHKVDTVFGYPGGAVLPFTTKYLNKKKIKHVLVRHEQAAIHAAEGYSRSYRKTWRSSCYIRSRSY